MGETEPVHAGKHVAVLGDPALQDLARVPVFTLGPPDDLLLGRRPGRGVIVDVVESERTELRP
ncbi:MAG: hypothetical protein R2705_19695 [Ilumatobacteraceae bacterium]